MTLIEKPVAGQPMRAGWGAAVADRLNQLGPFGVPGMLLRDGPFGQGSAPLPRNQRDRRASTKPLPFAPTFAADATTGELHISAIGPGYAPWGRRLLDVGSPPSSSSVWTTARGRLGLKITHPTTYSDTPTVEIIVAASSSSGTTASLPDSTDEISYLPLYDFDGGRITLDLRCYLALGVFE